MARPRKLRSEMTADEKANCPEFAKWEAKQQAKEQARLDEIAAYHAGRGCSSEGWFLCTSDVTDRNHNLSLSGRHDIGWRLDGDAAEFNAKIGDAPKAITLTNLTTGGTMTFASRKVFWIANNREFGTQDMVIRYKTADTTTTTKQKARKPGSITLDLHFTKAMPKGGATGRFDHLHQQQR
jgi:hypothetical protein